MQFTFHSASMAGRLFLQLSEERPFFICSSYDPDEFTIEAPSSGNLPRLHAQATSAIRALMRAMGEDKKLCTRCGVAKPFTSFSRNVARPDGMSVYCRECEVRRNRERRLADNIDLTARAG